jgi:hypothetical protein
MKKEIFIKEECSLQILSYNHVIQFMSVVYTRQKIIRGIQPLRPLLVLWIDKLQWHYSQKNKIEWEESQFKSNINKIKSYEKK